MSRVNRLICDKCGGIIDEEMMSNIQVGEYCRSKQGKIAKLIKKGKETNIRESYMTFDDYIIGYYGHGYKRIYEYDFKKITKHSFNIIDLIEKGDYVNGWKVDHFYEDEWNDFRVTDEISDNTARNQDIKSIVTKERFVESEYRINDN